MQIYALHICESKKSRDAEEEEEEEDEEYMEGGGRNTKEKKFTNLISHIPRGR